jgi:uncharacterized protein
MRLSLKLLISLSAIALIIYFLPQDYSAISRKAAEDLSGYLECFGVDNHHLVSEHGKTVQKIFSKYLLLEIEYEVPTDFPFDVFEKELRSLFEKKSLTLSKDSMLSGRVEYSILFKDNILCKIRLLKIDKGYLAIVLDDFGYNNKSFRYFKEISIPLNISVLPGLKYSKSASILAESFGHEVLLHLPMEPIKSKEIESGLERSTIKSTTPDREIAENIAAFLRELGNAKGVNNHMGSSLCRNREKIYTVLSSLKKQKVYFLDSQVIPDSKGPEIAEELGLKCFQRDVFIDNINDREYIKAQLREAIDLAKERGFAIAIGHDREKTLETILYMSDEIKSNSYPIKLSELE